MLIKGKIVIFNIFYMGLVFFVYGVEFIRFFKLSCIGFVRIVVFFIYL